MHANAPVVLNPEPIVQIIPSQPGTLAAGITIDMIQEKNPVIIQNYTGRNKEGVTQSTVQYVTLKTAQVNMSAYVKYLGSHGWALDTQTLKVAEDSSVQILAYKKSQTINVSMSADKVNHRSIVDISIVSKITTH